MAVGAAIDSIELFISRPPWTLVGIAAIASSVLRSMAFMDEVNYNGKPNQVTMVKRSTLSKTQ